MTAYGMKTYQIGLLQTKAYRALRNYMANYLKGYELSPMEWTLLGHIYDDKDHSIKSTDLSGLFQVEMSLMTNTINKLTAKGLVERVGHANDKRVKAILITEEGATIVEKIETQLSASLSEWMKDVDPEVMAHYVEMLRFLTIKSGE